ncbi:lactate utilization protein [Anaerobium acetethylicum]|uniref:Uncharacterized ACR, YkgG family COG1556 n=1 Tax=Anaerobium acetethylicum TaxID=1619234 RepID=A0A1D3TST4_9FIRM|nr:lactate utilization protein [Anaerobium acetethylicum]SCP96948.1 Uncharacterised ACR, YkgG family COG1556 [Anaerobium acetethylicum]
MDIERTIKNLRQKGYKVSCFENAEDAAAYLNRIIDQKSVGFGDSTTLLSMKLFERLSSHNEVLDPQNCAAETDFMDTAKQCLTTEVYLTSMNALSENGEIVNMDGTGNRIAGSLFGHEKVFFVCGTNKLVPTLEEAVWRVRNIAAPQNAMRLGLKTPCAKRGDRCYDCSSPERICNGMMIHFNKMHGIEMEVVLINEQLGF